MHAQLHRQAQYNETPLDDRPDVKTNLTRP